MLQKPTPCIALVSHDGWPVGERRFSAGFCSQSEMKDIQQKSTLIKKMKVKEHTVNFMLYITDTNLQLFQDYNEVAVISISCEKKRKEFRKSRRYRDTEI
jgi:hypothetical protein